MFFGDWLQRREMLSPSKVALIDAINDNQPITYREWNQRANQLANFFRGGLGLGKGDRVSIYAMNRVQYLDALFACNKLGAILHPVNWRLTVHELDALINDAARRVVLYSREFCSQIDELRPRLTTVEHFIALDHVTSNQYLHWPTERSKWPKTQAPPVELNGEDPWMICYTDRESRGDLLFRCAHHVPDDDPASALEIIGSVQSASSHGWRRWAELSSCSSPALVWPRPI